MNATQRWTRKNWKTERSTAGEPRGLAKMVTANKKSKVPTCPAAMKSILTSTQPFVCLRYRRA